MKCLRYEELVASLRNAGLQAGEVVHVQSDLSRIGPVDTKPTREAILEFFLAAFREVLGETGTISVGTSFEDYGRYGTPFVLEESPSRQGAFSEYVRTRTGARRSIHPIVSVSALGYRAADICDPPHFDGFGYESAWGRLHRLNARILAFGLGVEHEGGTTFFHYLEHLYGVPYQYTKLYEVPVFAGGKQVQGTFTMSVRYLDYGINNDTLRFKRLLVASGNALEVPVGRGRMLSATCRDIVSIGVECLNKDRYFLLGEPPRFRRGEIPMDGMTGPMQAVRDKSKA